MSSIRKKGLALVSGVALVGASLVAASPASAAYGPDDIFFTPDSGDLLSVFTLDEMDVTLNTSPFIPVDAAGTERLTYAFTSTNAPVLYVQWDSVTTADTTADVDLTGITAAGDVVNIADNVVIVFDDGAGGGAFAGDDVPGAFVVDFDEHDIVTLVVHNINPLITDKTQNLTIRVLDQTTANQTNTTPSVTEIGTLVSSPFGDGTKVIQAQAWLETGTTDAGDLTVDAAASDVETLTFWDQKDTSAVVRVTPFTSAAGDRHGVNGDRFVPAEVTFNRAVNLDMIDLTHFEWDLNSSVADDAIDDAGDAAGTVLARETMLGFDNQDDFGRLTVTIDMENTEALDDGEVISVSLTPVAEDGTDVATARTFRSANYEVREAADGDIDDLEYSVSPAAEAGDNEAGAVSIRSGVSAITYTATAVDAADEALGANYPVYAEVTFTDAAVRGDTITVSGNTRELPQAGVVIVQGVTNSDGQFSVTVTMENAEDGADYTVQFFYVDDAGDDQPASVALITATVGDTVFTTIETDSSAYNGSSITIVVNVEDQFGEAHSVEDGDAIKVRVEATDTDDLELFGSVVDGEATFTFDNFVEVGESDVLTVTAYTGADTDPTDLGSTLLTLYNSDATDSVTITDDDVTATVVYDDFVASGDEGNVAAADAVTLSGAVIDALGQGVPGAAVVVTGAELQFQNPAGDFSIGTANVTADEFGAWTVEVWTHTVGDVSVTITSGGESVTGNVEGELASGANALSAANLNIKWDLPAAVVTNTTYAVTVTVTDTWGNPVPGAIVQFAAAGSGTINGDATVDRTTRSNGTAVAFLRSLEDVTGIAGVSAQITAVDHDNDNQVDVGDLGSAFTDDEDTLRDESDATDIIDAQVTFLASAPAASADAKVNAGSFNGYVAVYAKGYKGQTLSWKIAGQWFKTTITEDYQVFQRTTAAVGVDVTVELYINGQRPAALVKQVLTR
jgi:protocatechuate 3,4-dioxygenase beta subunit